MSNPADAQEAIEALARIHLEVLRSIGIEITPDEAADEVRQVWREVSLERMKLEMHKLLDAEEETGS